MSFSLLRLRIHLLVFAALAGSASAQDVTLRWVPAAGTQIAGYKAYIGPAGSGPLVAAAIDVGRPTPAFNGVASVRLTGVDRTAPLLWIEMTSYDSFGRESARSNRAYLAGDGETVDPPRWSADFENLEAGTHPTGFVDWGSYFGLQEASDDGIVLGGRSRSADSLAVSRYLGAWSRSWAPYELTGRMQVFAGSTSAGVGVRVETADLSSSFLLGGDGQGEFALDQLGKPDLRCALSPSTGVRVERGDWYSFRLRHTAPDGRARLRAKVWRPGEIEPSRWQADCWTDAPPETDGGAFALYQAGAGISYWDDLVVRTVTGTYSRPPSF